MLEFSAMLELCSTQPSQIRPFINHRFDKKCEELVRSEKNENIMSQSRKGRGKGLSQPDPRLVSYLICLDSLQH